MPGEWYEGIKKPWWTPPNWLFPVAWTILYIMIAIAGWLVWQHSGWSTALAIWGIGLVLNALWSYFMFGRQEIGFALADVAALWLSVALFIAAAWNLDRTAAYLFVPYLVWVTIASALNFEVWRLN
jgi:tryptophan-rich sensory protein